MLSYTRPVANILPIVTLSVLLMSTAAAEETATPACMAKQDNPEKCCSAHAHPDGVADMDMFARMSTELALSDPQKQELATLLEMYRPRLKELAERGMTSGQAMLEIAPDDASYNIRAAELSQLAGASAAEMVTLLTELQANAYALLTTEQQARFLSLRAEQRQKMEAKRAQMQEYRATGDWQGHHCMHISAPTADSTASGATE